MEEVATRLITLVVTSRTRTKDMGKTTDRLMALRIRTATTTRLIIPRLRPVLVDGPLRLQEWELSVVDLPLLLLPDMDITDLVKIKDHLAIHSLRHVRLAMMDVPRMARLVTALNAITAALIVVVTIPIAVRTEVMMDTVGSVSSSSHKHVLNEQCMTRKAVSL
jgi:hypothetical protein